MTLNEANKKLEKLDIDYNYWLNEKEELMKLVRPQAVDTTKMLVDGGKRVDRLLAYTEKEDEKKINETLDYINAKRINLMDWIDAELKRIGKYNAKALKIYELRYDEEYMRTHDGKKREWWKIAQAVNLTSRQCQRILSKMIKKRNI